MGLNKIIDSNAIYKLLMINYKKIYMQNDDNKKFIIRYNPFTTVTFEDIYFNNTKSKNIREKVYKYINCWSYLLIMPCLPFS